MTAATKERKAVKTVQIIARVQFKNDARKVVYLVRASNGIDQYETYFFDGRALSCTCNSRKPCYHMTQCEQKETERADRLDTAAWMQELAGDECQPLELAEIDLRPNADGNYRNLLTYCMAMEEEYTRVETDEDAQYDAWKAEHNLDNTMSREQYVRTFDPCGLEA